MQSIPSFDTIDLLVEEKQTPIQGNPYRAQNNKLNTSDKLGIVQIEQDVAVCKAKFKHLIAKPIGAQFLSNNLIALFEFEETNNGISIVAEKHYRLVEAEQLSNEELLQYRKRTE